MPFVYQQNINLYTRLGVWHISEEEGFFKDIVLQREITHPHKRLQHLAGRYLLQTLYPGFPLHMIRIAETRRPFLDNDPFHFSISHCGDYAAVIVSRENRVGVDIEITTPKAVRLQKKFLNDDEISLPRPGNMNEEEFFTLCWSIKESVFKWHAKGGLDFRRDIHIRSINHAEEAWVCNSVYSGDVPLVVKAIRINKNWLTWLVT